MNSRIYVHSPKPPFYRIAGPIPYQNLTREIEISVGGTANITVSIADINADWLLPGMCWLIDDGDIGEDLWGGFVERQVIPFRATAVEVPLIGAKEALLAVEFGVRLPVPVSKGFAVQRALEAAQALDIGVYPGLVDQEGAAVELDVRGETISGFIDSIQEASAGAAWRERTVEDDGKLQFFLDFGFLQRKTNIILGPEDIVDGSYERGRVVSSVTAIGQGVGFEVRDSATTSLGDRVGGQAPDGPMLALEQPAIDFMNTRLIGPAAARHVIEINERFGGNSLESHARERHLEYLTGVDTLTLTLDATRSNVRRLKLADIVTLAVPDWGAGQAIEAEIYITRIEPMADEGRRAVEAGVLI